MASEKSCSCIQTSISLRRKPAATVPQKVLFPERKLSFEKPGGAYFVCAYRTSDLQICNYLWKTPYYYYNFMVLLV